jgi:hypothetical protein
MILLLDAMETGDLGRIWKVEQVYALFHELRKKRVHKLASLAVERISWGILELQKMQDDVKMREKGPLLSGGEGLQRLGIKTLWSGKNEAGMCSSSVQDTVMGNTGMLLLEDPGLQSFVDEAFSPLTWAMAGNELERSSKCPVRPKKQEEDQKFWGSQLTPREKHDTDTLNHEMYGSRSSRSSEELQGEAGRVGSALGSAQVRFATFPTAPPSREQGQPQGLPSPTSPPDSTTFVHGSQHQHQHYGQGQGHGHEQFQGWQQLHPPLSRHHSYPSLHHMCAPIAMQPSELAMNSDRNYADGPIVTLDDHPTSTDCITAPDTLAPSYPSLHSLSGPGSTSGYYETDHSSVHSMWTARPAAPISSLSEPALGVAPASADGHAMPLPDQHQGYHHHNFPLRSSVAGGAYVVRAEMERWAQ